MKRWIWFLICSGWGLFLIAALAIVMHHENSRPDFGTAGTRYGVLPK